MSRVLIQPEGDASTNGEESRQRRRPTATRWTSVLRNAVLEFHSSIRSLEGGRNGGEYIVEKQDEELLGQSHFIFVV